MTGTLPAHEDRSRPRRSPFWLWGAAALSSSFVLGAIFSSGCSTLADDCVEGRCWEPEGAGGSGSGTGTGTPTGTAAGTSSGTATGTGSGTNTGTGDCIPGDKPRDGGCVSDGDGVFVRSDGDDTGAGTRDDPVQTVALALSLADSAGKSKIYLCAGTYDEAVLVPAGSELYGALDCDAGWTWSGEATTIAPSGSGAIPLTLDSAGGGDTLLEDIRALAPDASGPGVSSIALLANGGNAELQRCHLQSGLGDTGATGTDAPATQASSGEQGNPGQNTACDAEILGGGAELWDSHCGTTTRGGKGGLGGNTSGGPGFDGSPMPNAGTGGPGEPSSGIWLCPLLSMTGGDGTVGGAGQGGTGLGTIHAGGYTGNSGGNGSNGGAGKGGGGGGGAKKHPSCPFVSNGPSGGSGGTGGCGGQSGGGGSEGGSSIAVISLQATLTLIETTVIAGDGGSGGRGGNGQTGGSGGLGGLGGNQGSNQGCNGGPGGDGGPGGPGGGGLGGHSVGVAYTGVAPSLQGGSVAHGAFGSGGPGGDNDVEANGGIDGVGADLQAF